MSRFRFTVVMMILVITTSGCSVANGSSSKTAGASKSKAPAAKATKPGLKLETHNGGFFSVKKPKAWKVITAGDGPTFAWVIRDPSCSARQIFMFSEAGPFYMSERQQSIDQWYMNNSGYPIQWIDMPVVDPLTPANFVKQFSVISRSNIAREFMRGRPTLENFQEISSQPISGKLPLPGAKTALVRGGFSQDGKVGQGLFLVTVAPHVAFMNGPGGGTGYAYLFIGITAPKNEFPQIAQDMIACVDSFTVSEEWVRSCMQRQQDQWKGVLEAGKTLRQSSEIVTKGWHGRSREHDASMERYYDSVRGVERVYDPETGEVYEVPNGWYQDYNLDPDKWNKPRLQPLPNDPKWWNKPVLSGDQHIKLAG